MSRSASRPTDGDDGHETLETRDWLQSLEEVLHSRGAVRVRQLLSELQIRAQRAGVELPVTSQTPYVNTIPPEFIDTPMLRAAEASGKLGKGVEFHASQTPVRRAGLPSDIAAMTAYLVSDEAGYVTGQVLGVNGGRKT